MNVPYASERASYGKLYLFGYIWREVNVAYHCWDRDVENTVWFLWLQSVAVVKAGLDADIYSTRQHNSAAYSYWRYTVSLSKLGDAGHFPADKLNY